MKRKQIQYSVIGAIVAFFVVCMPSFSADAEPGIDEKFETKRKVRLAGAKLNGVVVGYQQEFSKDGFESGVFLSSAVSHKKNPYIEAINYRDGEVQRFSIGVGLFREITVENLLNIELVSEIELDRISMDLTGSTYCVGNSCSTLEYAVTYDYISWSTGLGVQATLVPNVDLVYYANRSLYERRSRSEILSTGAFTSKFNFNNTDWDFLNSSFVGIEFGVTDKTTLSILKLEEKENPIAAILEIEF